MHDIEFCRRIAEDRQGKCLSKLYSHCCEKLLWECKKGHQWYTSLTSIYNQKSWCPECSKEKRLKYGKKKKLNGIKIAQGIAALKGGKCLSKEYKNSTYQKLLWKCKKGHQWYASLNSVKDNKTWCLKCSGSEKFSIEIAKKEAKKRKGKCLSNKYINSGTNLIWKCVKGHIFKASLKSIKNRNSWCKQCYRPSITIEELKEIAIEKEGECLSFNYSPNEKLLWKCKEGHLWKATARNIKLNRAWCPECGRINAAKKGRHTFIIQHWKTGEELICTGSYELKTVEYFNKNKINFLWQFKTFFISDKKSYRPDAYLIKENKWIEIKGYFREVSKEKWNWFHENYPNSELWDRVKLIELAIL